MCGIAGGVFFEPALARQADAIVSRMTDAMAHRGPDGRGVVILERTPERTVALGHRRLAIIDLTDRAAQPMTSPRVPVSLTFNGEIYNFADIRSDLEAVGRSFVSDSDTEVILQAYEVWGADMVHRLRGMFACGIWDARTRTLLLARDRLGIKPLYIFQSGSVILFASEVRALLASGLVPRRLDHEAVVQYLAHQTVPPPRTLLAGVRLLAPGYIAEVAPDRRLVERCYWDLLDAASDEGRQASEGDARDAIHTQLIESTRLHLVSDVPVGVFLSGGIDSSALVALTREAGVTPRTFTVVLPGSPHDEAPFARTIAQRFHAEHTEITISEHEMRDDLDAAVTHVDHPSGDGFNSFVVSRAVRRAGVKVALSGLGGDEMFGGYPSFRRLSKLSPYARVWRRSPEPLRAAAAAAVRTLGRASVGSVKTAAVIETDGSVPQAFPLMRQLFSHDARCALLGEPLVRAVEADGDPYSRLLERAVERHPDAGLMSLVAYAEARTYMHDVLLRDTDQMSMAHGLEVRVPLLDHVLAEYVMGLPDGLKSPERGPKQLLVDSLGDALPDECVRRPKQGFVLPFDTWMRGELRPFCETHLGPEGLGGRGLFNPAALAGLWQSFLRSDGRTTWSRLWTLVALDAWIDANRIEV